MSGDETNFPLGEAMVLSCSFSFAADMILLSFWFLVPAVTIVLTGPALIALYQTIDQLYQEKDVPVWQRYSRAFLANIKRGIVLEGSSWVCWLSPRRSFMD